MNGTEFSKQNVMKTNYPQRIHISGFDINQKKKLSNQIESLGGIVDQSLTGKTDFLVCKSILIEKFRIAKILGIRTISSDWIFQSFQKGSFEPVEQFEFGVFEDLNVGFLGFERKTAIKLGRLVLKNKGRLISLNGNFFLVYYVQNQI